MGLYVYCQDVEIWNGAYSAFHRWRSEIARLSGVPSLEFMEGFFESNFQLRVLSNVAEFMKERNMPSANLASDAVKDLKSFLPIKWDCLKPSPLHQLLYHSDCDGTIRWSSCRRIADALENLIPLLPKEEDSGHIGNWEETTRKFVSGLRYAYENKKTVHFA